MTRLDDIEKRMDTDRYDEYDAVEDAQTLSDLRYLLDRVRLAETANALFWSNGPLTDTLVGEGPWWSKPETAGESLYNAMHALDVKLRE